MRGVVVFLLTVVGIFFIDQGIKEWAVNSVSCVEYAKILVGKCIDLELHYNRGVSFSMLSFLGSYLKWIQASLVVLILFIIVKEGYLKRYAFPAGLIVGGALGNVYDRFHYDGVVDYVAWHCGFNYAVFNFADVAIDVGIVLVAILIYFFPEKSKKEPSVK